MQFTYDEKAQQKLLLYTDAQGDTNKIWLEDFQSLAGRRKLSEKYCLAGLAAWSLEWMDAGQQAWHELQRY